LGAGAVWGKAAGLAAGFSAGLALTGGTAAAEETVLPEITVTAERAGGRPGQGQVGGGGFDEPDSSSERTVTGERIADRPITRPGEVLEATPGLIVTQHSGEGKANQYFLRGFNLDHGSDLAIHVDGMPVNMRTHGHGQGYADLNFLIPELVGAMHVRKGPYFAEEGDFASAGSVHIGYIDRVDHNMWSTSFGSFGYGRALTIASHKAGEGQVLAAVEGSVYDGPWETPDRVRKINTVLRYSQGDAANGFSLTGMAYANRWNATDQIPARAVASGLIGRFDTLDPTDGGDAGRFSLSGRWSRTDQAGSTRVNAYAIRSTLNLFNNFTYFLSDPVNGDQFRQFDRRTLVGGHASHTFKHAFGGLPSETEFGLQTRHDDIRLGLETTRQRRTLGVVRHDSVSESSAAVYVENRTRWTPWLRTSLGLRADAYHADVRSDLHLNSGRVSDAIVSPKFGLVLGPWADTDVFFNAGRGFHSNDARGATIRVDPVDGVTPLERAPLLVRAEGAEAGVRTRAIAGLDSALTAFVLDFQSENLFVGDAGTTEPSRPSRRYGLEWTNHYKMASWLAFDLDVTWTHARFRDADPAGSRVPGAPTLIAAAGVTLGDDKKGWFGGAKLRFFGPRPLIEDDSARSPSTTLVNARLGYAFADGLKLQLDVLNLFNAKASQIDYFYESRLPGEPIGGVADRHFHPVEPLAVRLTLAGRW
jgi:outer membrane receptor protein involved in Fe transport